MELEVFLGERQIGILTHSTGGGFSFTYDAAWLADPERFALSAYLPLPDEENPARLPRISPEHSTVVQDFFQNLLPEGKSLDAAAATELPTSKTTATITTRTTASSVARIKSLVTRDILNWSKVAHVPTCFRGSAPESQ